MSRLETSIRGRPDEGVWEGGQADRNVCEEIREQDADTPTGLSDNAPQLTKKVAAALVGGRQHFAIIEE